MMYYFRAAKKHLILMTVPGSIVSKQNNFDSFLGLYEEVNVVFPDHPSCVSLFLDISLK